MDDTQVASFYDLDCTTPCFAEVFKFRKYSSLQVVFIYDFDILKLINHFKTINTDNIDSRATTQLPKNSSN